MNHMGGLEWSPNPLSNGLDMPFCHFHEKDTTPSQHLLLHLVCFSRHIRRTILVMPVKLSVILVVFSIFESSYRVLTLYNII